MTLGIAPFQNTETSMSNLLVTIIKDGGNTMEPDVKVTNCDIRKAIEFKQHKNYRLSQEQYNKWPKIYSISLDQNNKQTVTLEFRNDPNLGSVRNLLHLYSAEYAEQKYSFSIKGKSSSINTIRIEKNSLNVVAHLIDIYGEMSSEAGALIWEAFRYIVEDAMDKDTNNLGWKSGISYMISAWAESSQNLDDDSCDNHLSINYSDNPYHFDHNAKLAYSHLSQEDQQKFLQAIISHIVKLNAAAIFENLPHNNKYTIIEEAFNTIEKCNKYIDSNLAHIKDFSNNIQELATQEFTKAFDPTFFETLFSDQMSKHVKSGSAGVGALLSIIKKLGSEIPGTGILYATMDVAKIIYSAVYVDKALQDKENDVKPIDIPNLSHMLICKDIICNYQILQDLTPDSLKKLVNFYGHFAYQEIKNNPSIDEESYLSSYLLKQMENPESIIALDLTEFTAVFLEDKYGDKFTIADFIAKYNQTACYDELLKILGGEIDPSTPTLQTSNQPSDDSSLTLTLNQTETSKNETAPVYEETNLETAGEVQESFYQE